MSHYQPTDRLAFTNWQSQPIQEVFPGIKVSSVWQGEVKGKAPFRNHRTWGYMARGRCS